MFGYVTVNEAELTEEEKIRYRSYYCGLCHILKERYGQIGQMTLTYDMTFLVILLTALYEPEGISVESRCIAHPLKKHLSFTNECTEYAAAMNILLAYHNCMDDWIDDKSILKLGTAKLLKKSYRQLAHQYPEKVAAVERYMDRVHAAESDATADLDTVAGYTGELLGELFVWKDDIWSKTLYRMGYFLGKFIYLMDAYDDLAKDEKKKSYNPLHFYQNNDDFEIFCQNILTMMMTDCATEFERLPILLDVSILRNILYSGVWRKYSLLTTKKSKTGENKDV